MRDIIKDIVSLLVYVFIAPFFRNERTILVYHSIDNIEKEKDPYKMNVKPPLFKKHMEYISKRKADYAVTFDDGFKSVYINAFPLIKQYGIKSTLFLTTDFIDAKINLNSFFGNKCSPEPLAWAEIKDMASSGLEIGSHGLTHRKMAELSIEEGDLEAEGSRERIKRMTGFEPVSFAYPFGDKSSFSGKTLGVLRHAGYKRVYTNIMGMDNSAIAPNAITRIRIYGTDNMFRFRMKVRGAYNWIDFCVPLLAGLLKRSKPFRSR